MRNVIDETLHENGLRHRSLVVACGLAAALTLGCAGAAPALATDVAADDEEAVEEEVADEEAVEEDEDAEVEDADDIDEDKHYTKSQVVYVKTDAEGYQTGVYVVNSFEAVDNVTVTDDGVYQSVSNLSDSQKLVEDDDSIKFDVDDDSIFRYEGRLHSTTEVPWDVSIKYTLNGENVKIDNLPGVSGKLKMELTITNNTACDPVYADNYLLQVSAEFDDDIVSHISAPGATMAQEGGNTKLSYMRFPGAGETVTYTITATVEDFEYDGWTIAGVPLSMDLDLDNADIEVSDVSSMDDLADGIAEVNDGAHDLADGVHEAGDGIDELDASSADLKSGADELASSVSDSLVPGLESLAEGSQTYAQNLASNASDAQAQADAIDVDAAQQAYQDAMAAYVQAYVTVSVYGGDVTTDQSVIDTGAAMQEALTALVTAQAQKSSYQTAADTLNQSATGYAELDSGIQGMVDAESESSVYALQSGADELASGVASYTDGVSELASGYAELEDGADELASGTQELYDETRDLNGRVTSGIKDAVSDYLNADFTLVDFVNGQEDNIKAVQFVIMTESVEIPDEEPEVPTRVEEKSFMEKLRALFE